MQDKYGYAVISSLEDQQFLEHRAHIIEIRYRAMNDFIKHLLFAILMKEHKISQPGSFGTAKAAKIIISLEALKKKAEAIIAIINKFVEESYHTEEEKNRRRKETVGREVERIRKYAAENGLDLPTPLNNWHILKRNVEEIAILIGEANRIIDNYERELYSLNQKNRTHFVKLRILDVTRRLRTAKALLGHVARAIPPVLSPNRHSDNLSKKVVVFFEVDLIDNAMNNHVYVDDQEGEADNDGVDDADLVEEGEPNPEEEILITFDDLVQESMSND